MQRIAELYAIEAQANTLTINERQQRRQEQAQPKLETMHAWLISTRQQTADGSALAKPSITV